MFENLVGLGDTAQSILDHLLIFSKLTCPDFHFMAPSYIAGTCQILSLAENPRWRQYNIWESDERGHLRWEGTPHIPFWEILSDVQTRVGTPHKILRCLRSRGDTAHSNWGYLVWYSHQGGAPVPNWTKITISQVRGWVVGFNLKHFQSSWKYSKDCYP